MRLKDRVAIVTGGASGIGRAIARRFAEEGARVVVADVTTEPREGGAPTQDLIAAAGGTALFTLTDVSKWDQVDALVGATVARFGRLDVMVNNAAVSAGKPLLEEDEAGWDRIMAVNLKGVFFGCKRAVQQMLEQEPLGQPPGAARGRIVNLSSQHGMICAPNDIAYGVSKAGCAYITRQIAADYAERGIVCNAVAPGKILTGKPGRAQSPEALARAQARTPMARLGTPRDVANAALFLASDEASYMTGVNLMVDGGWMAG
ncbi:MAG: SDR family oxidoreductase [Proteobacteria bacterium]|nr:SDR family oxidoreductase [Pseudomonadota bacterium]